MARLLIHVEGQTEEGFVNEVLRDHLVSKGYHSVEARIVGNARLRQRRGGIRPWPSVKADIVNHLREDPGCIATTMVDYYALPQGHPGGWPGRAESKKQSSIKRKAFWVQDAVHKNLVAEMGGGFDSKRFVPFVVMHEFEGLLFSDCVAFSHSIGRSDLEISLRKIQRNFQHQRRLMIRRTQRLRSAWKISYPATRSRFWASLLCWRLACPGFVRNAHISTPGLRTSNLL